MNMQQMMRQVTKDAKELAKAQEEIASMTFEGSAGGGMVKVVASGDMKISSITIDPDVVDPEDVEMLQDMVCAAVNEALRCWRSKQSAYECCYRRNEYPGLM